MTHADIVDNMTSDIGEEASNEEAVEWLRREIMATVSLRLGGDKTVDVTAMVDSARAICQDMASDVGDPELWNLQGEFYTGR